MTHEGRGLTGARTRARKRAVNMLYAADLRGESAVEALESAVAAGEGPPHPYTAVLVRGVSAHLAEIDEVLGRYSTGWSVDRMPAVDRSVLRLAVWELLHADDVPGHVAVTEAVALVAELSTDESPQFVNGLLGAIERDRRSEDRSEGRSDETAPAADQD